MISYHDDLKNALEVLKSGGIILYPTDTIWGLGCDACNSEAVDRIFEIKKRIDSKSMIVLVNTDFMIERYIDDVPEIAYQLIEVAEKPLTIIYPNAKFVAENLIAEDKSLAIRVSNEKFSNNLIARFKRPIVSTSANISGEASPANFSKISKEIINSVDYIVKFRQEETTESRASEIIKFNTNGSFKIIRK